MDSGNSVTDNPPLETPKTKWADIIGLEKAKDVLHAEIVLPVKFPYLFEGKRQAYNPVLLYGPYEREKSCLAEAAAGEAGARLLREDAQKSIKDDCVYDYVSRLFETARKNAPAVIFIENVEVFIPPKKSLWYTWNPFLQMDKISTDREKILVIGTTSAPWHLLETTLERFRTRLYIPRPNMDIRIELLKRAIGSTPCAMRPDDYHEVSLRMEGFFDRDISEVVQLALMYPMRRIRRATHYKQVSDNGAKKLTPCSPFEAGAKKMSWDKITTEKLLEPPLYRSDFLEIIDKFSKTTDFESDVKLFDEWTRSHGQEGEYST